MHHTPLIAMIVAGLVGAFVLGALAHRLRLPPLVGYLLAGVLVGPFTPGYVADQGLADQLAEIGVILLMFGVGLHFSLKDLMAVKAVAIPGAIGQMVVATLLGMGLGLALGWPLGVSVVFGVALSVASTVVLLRALQERRLLQSERGRIAVGWLIVEDLAMVLALVMLPALAGVLNGEPVTDPWRDWGLPLAVTIGKVAGFVAFMLLVGRRVIPWLLHAIAHTGSRELFRLAVLAIALGVAFGAAALFGVSFALGAFFAGMILAESELSHRAAEETLPLRDAFAVLFFVSVGMLFNPAVIVEQPLALAGTLAIIIVGKSLAALAILRMFGHPAATGLTIAASLAQIGEFSFILSGLGASLGLLPPAGRDLILAAAIISIMLNPLIFAVMVGRQKEPAAKPAAPDPEAPAAHVIVVGFGRVGAPLAAWLGQGRRRVVVIDERDEAAAAAEAAGFRAVCANAAEDSALDEAGVTRAQQLYVTLPDGFEAGQVVEKSRRANPGLEIIVRALSDAEGDHLKARGADRVVLGDREIARGMYEAVSDPLAGAA